MLDIPVFADSINKNIFIVFDTYSVSQAVMEHSATKGDDRLKGKCIDETEGPGTDINPECIQAAKEATFMDRYNVTVTYNEKVGMGGGDNP